MRQSLADSATSVALLPRRLKSWSSSESSSCGCLHVRVAISSFCVGSVCASCSPIQRLDLGAVDEIPSCSGFDRGNFFSVPGRDRYAPFAWPMARSEAAACWAGGAACPGAQLLLPARDVARRDTRRTARGRRPHRALIKLRYRATEPADQYCGSRPRPPPPPPAPAPAPAGRPRDGRFLGDGTKGRRLGCHWT